jgi:hypothetical protein
MPPLTCPPPESTEPDCPLYEQRVAFAPGKTLRRAILTERRQVPDLTALIRAEQQPLDSAQAALPPGQDPAVLNRLDQLLEEVK